MEIVVATEILKRAGISRDEFAGMCGVKPVSMRMTFQNGRFSKKAIAKLDELVGEVRERVGIEEVDELIEEAREIKAGMIRQTTGNPIEVMGTKVKVRKVKGDEWELCGEYDRKDRLV